MEEIATPSSDCSRGINPGSRGNCSLVDSANRCKCLRKTRAFIESGFVDPQKLEFKAGYRRHVREIAETRADEWREAYEKVAANQYRDHPFYESAEQASILRTALGSVSLDATKTSAQLLSQQPAWKCLTGRR